MSDNEATRFLALLRSSWRRATSSKKGLRVTVVAAALLSAAIGLSVGFTTSQSPTATASSVKAVILGVRSGLAGGNARSAPAAGGASGTVGGVSTSIFTITTSAGQQVSIDEIASTTFLMGSSSTSASAVTKGERVLVLGTTNSATITATQVIVGYQPASKAATATVTPFRRGAPTDSQQVGQIPANWSQGSGTIVGGTAANKATEAALAAYPGGIVDRVVKLSNGEYNVHYIGVNWPHHVFVSASFGVVGAL